MNGSGKYWVLHLLANVVVTLAFLVFAWYFRDFDKNIASLVIGGSMAHWFSSSTVSGRGVTRAIEGPTFNVPPPATVSVEGGRRKTDQPSSTDRRAGDE